MQTFTVIYPICSPMRAALTRAKKEIRSDNFPQSSLSIAHVGPDGKAPAQNTGWYELSVTVRDKQLRWAKRALWQAGFELAQGEAPKGGTLYEPTCSKKPKTGTEYTPRQPVNWWRNQAREQPHRGKSAQRGVMAALRKMW